MNGSMGEVLEVLYEEAPSDHVLPAVILVKFPSYTGPPALESPYHPQVVPITPANMKFMRGTTECVRTNFPLRLSWAITIHKSQGMSFGEGHPIKCCIIHLGPAEDVDGLSYVAASRNMSHNLMVFGGRPGEDLDCFPGGDALLALHLPT